MPDVTPRLRKRIVDALVQCGMTKKDATICEKSIYANFPSDYCIVAYEKIGQLKSGTPSQHVLQDIKKKIKGWGSHVYNPIKNTYENRIFQDNTKIKPVKGMYKCKNKECGSDEFYIWNETRRSGDEGQATIRQCSKCGKRGREN
jgi:DNA-directed RNA polymerase subunit M/transcription elongation factor TFIIS